MLLPSNYSSRLGLHCHFQVVRLVAELVVDGTHTDPEIPPPVPTTMPSHHDGAPYVLEPPS